MEAIHKKLRVCSPNERGQTLLFVLLALGLFLLGAIAFGTDIANLWFHRQAAQTAADAACTAGAMDLLYYAEGVSAPGSPAGAWGWIGQPADCNGESSTYGPCWYAAQNGYTASSANQVLLDNWGASPPTYASLGVPPCSSSTPSGQVCGPDSNLVANPIVQVNINDPVRVFFAGMISGKRTMNVGAQAICGVVALRTPVPLLILDPAHPPGSGKGAYAFNVQGNPSVSISGGPQESIQVNSTDPNYAANAGGAGIVNLTCGGQLTPPTGSMLGITAPLGGLSLTTSSSSCPGSGTSGIDCGTGDPKCVINHPPIVDPFANYGAPGQAGLPSGPQVPTANGTVTPAAPGTNGCPSNAPLPGCIEYGPGVYTAGIDVKNQIAIFDPGLYEMEGSGLVEGPGSCMLPSTNDSAGTGWGGTTFYFVGSATLNITSNGGTACPPNAFNTTNVKCSGSSYVPSNLPGTINGSVLLAPCTGPYGDPFQALGESDPCTGSTASLTCQGEQRGILFFQDRSATTINTQTTGPSYGGAGSILLAGAMYFHSCNSSGTGQTCGDPPTYYSDYFSLQGAAGSTTYVLGDIVTDNLVMGGGGTIVMDLNPAATAVVLKASLLQ